MSEFQPYPGMQEFWDKNPAQLEQFGEGTEDMARLAAGFGGADVQAVARNVTGATKSLLPGDVHGGNLEQEYADVNDPSWNAAELDIDLNNLDKIENRMNLLDGLTQNAEGGGVDANGRCATTALMAAAIHAGGKDGIRVLLDAAKSGADPKDELAKMKFADLEQKMKDGKLNQADLSSLNDELYLQLREQQAADFKKNGWKVPMSGLAPEQLQKFIAGNDKMAEYFKSGKYSIDSVDTNGNAGSEEAANHYVLSIGGENNNFVYDPQARKDGHQVVVNPVDVQNYHNKEWKPDRVDAADFGATPFDGMY
ncbi:MAG: hypothetical protein AB7T06_32780 [Kofleriaceae bacterium]